MNDGGPDEIDGKCTLPKDAPQAPRYLERGAVDGRLHALVGRHNTWTSYTYLVLMFLLCSNTHRQANFVAPSSLKYRFLNSLDLIAERWRGFMPMLSASAFCVMPCALNCFNSESSVTSRR